jgi:hypothetical protein
MPAFLQFNLFNSQALRLRPNHNAKYHTPFTQEREFLDYDQSIRPAEAEAALHHV